LEAKRENMVEEKKHTDIGIAALVLGIVGIVITFIPSVSIISIPIAILAVVFGYMARKRGDSYGLVGLILGIIIIVFVVVSIILAIIFHVWISGWSPSAMPLLIP